MSEHTPTDELNMPDLQQLPKLQRLQLQLQIFKMQRQQLDAQIVDYTKRIVKELDLETTLFHVTIHDAWDDGDSRYPSDSADVTCRGLAAAVKAAEGDNPRTDNVLRYWVTARTDSGDFSIPQKMWLPFSKQTAKTLRTIR